MPGKAPTWTGRRPQGADEAAAADEAAEQVAVPVHGRGPMWRKSKSVDVGCCGRNRKSAAYFLSEAS